MAFLFTKQQHVLAIRGVLFVLALGGIIGLIDAREYITSFPFNIQEILDAVIIFAFFIIALKIKNMLPKHRIKIMIVFGLSWAYTIVSNLANLWLFVSARGLEETLNFLGTTIPMFALTQILLLLVIPTILFLFLSLCVHRVSAENIKWRETGSPHH